VNDKGKMSFIGAVGNRGSLNASCWGGEREAPHHLSGHSYGEKAMKWNVRSGFAGRRTMPFVKGAEQDGSSDFTGRRLY